MAPRKPTGRHVAIFGAGIAGLTAAHELVERGFTVEIWEPTPPSVPDRIMKANCSIGGMARTQWGRVEKSAPGQPPMQRARPLKVYVDNIEVPFEGGEDDDTIDGEAKDALDEIVKAVKGEVQHLFVMGFMRPAWARKNNPPTDQESVDIRRAKNAKKYLEQQLQGVSIEAFGCGIGHNDDWTRSPAERDYVSVTIVENWLPGEHGFRFFPAFYRHLFDTMGRIPIPDEDQEPYLETPRTVLDNVTPTAFMGLVTDLSDRMLEFRRTPIASLEELFQQLRQALKALGHTLDDVRRFQLRLFQYMTSCPERRAEYERMSWSEFLRLDEFSENFRRYVESTAQTLVGMQAARSDARTYGNVSVQMLLDQFAASSRTDGTLNGPTTTAWFNHWRRYLEVQGVQFRRGSLVTFDVHAGEPFPVVEDQDEGRKKLLSRDYYVLALPADELQRIVTNKELQGDDFDRIRNFPLGKAHQAETGGALEHMTGVQYYLESDVKVLRGHIIYPDTPWRLSSVSQPQFWVQKRGWWSGYRGIVSVDISNLHAENPAWGKPADEIADLVWQQLTTAVGQLVSVDASGDGRERPNPAPLQLPRPLYYHIDENLEFDGSKEDGPLKGNRSPYLLARPGEYGLRPGCPGRYQPDASGRIVVAGVLMQTYTRLTTMESANESARHAVNAILEAAGYVGERCPIWDPELNEMPELRFLVELDRKLMEPERKLPHLVDILDLREVPQALLQPDPDLRSLGIGGPEAS